MRVTSPPPPKRTERWCGQTEFSDLLVEGCLFDGGYANLKGGGVSQDNGYMTVLGSVFYDNVAGGNNLEHGESCQGHPSHDHGAVRLKKKS